MVEEYGKENYYIDLPRSSLYVLVKPKQYIGKDSYSTVVRDESDFMIKVKHNIRRNVKNNHYKVLDGGKLSYDFTGENTRFNLSWGEVWLSDIQGFMHKVENPKYYVLASKNKNARLNSACALRKEMANEFVIASFETSSNEYQFKNGGAGEKYYINVLA